VYSEENRLRKVGICCSHLQPSSMLGGERTACSIAQTICGTWGEQDPWLLQSQSKIQQLPQRVSDNTVVRKRFRGHGTCYGVVRLDPRESLPYNYRVCYTDDDTELMFRALSH
jgi:hypothetical protein